MGEEKTTNLYDFDDFFYKSLEGEVYKNILVQVEKPLFEWVLKRTEGNQIKAAKILGINRNTLRAKIRKLGISPDLYNKPR